MPARCNWRLSTRITSKNLDLASKYLADSLGSRSLSIYGVDIPPIIDCIPTELPSIDATLYSCDRIFKLADGSHLLIEFESQYRKKNFFKYLRYVPRILEAIDPDDRLRLLVVYTADVLSAHARFETNCLTLESE